MLCRSLSVAYKVTVGLLTRINGRPFVSGSDAGWYEALTEEVCAQHTAPPHTGRQPELTAGHFAQPPDALLPAGSLVRVLQTYPRSRGRVLQRVQHSAQHHFPYFPSAQIKVDYTEHGVTRLTEWLSKAILEWIVQPVRCCGQATVPSTACDASTGSR